MERLVTANSAAGSHYEQTSGARVGGQALGVQDQGRVERQDEELLRVHTGDCRGETWLWGGEVAPVRAETVAAPWDFA